MTIKTAKAASGAGLIGIRYAAVRRQLGWRAIGV